MNRWNDEMLEAFWLADTSWLKPSDWLTLADCLDRKASSEYDLAHTRRLHKLVSSQDPALAQLLLGEKLHDRV